MNYTKDQVLDMTGRGKLIYDHIARAYNLQEIPDNGCHHQPNPFRDGHGSVSYGFRGDRWMHKDFGDDTFTGDCFQWAGHYFGIDPGSNFGELLQRIVQDIAGAADYTKQPATFVPVEQPKQTQFYSMQDVARSAGRSLLHEHFGQLWPDRAADVLQAYHVGRTIDGRTVFWFMDRAQQARSCKVVEYRKKEATISKKLNDQGRVRIRVHRPAGQPSDPCLFGEHLVEPGTKQLCAIVEAEDAALAAAICFPGFHWLASGGTISRRQLDRLKDCRLLVCPDLDVLRNEAKREQLQSNISRWSTEGIDVHLWPLMEELSQEAASFLLPGKLQKMDVRDYLEGGHSSKEATPQQEAV